MKQLLCTALICFTVFTSCVTTLPATAPGSRAADDSRNYVMIMHGESCDAENVASNMYCENSHETATISVTVDVTWIENGQARHQNQTVSVPPNGKTLLGCEWTGNGYRRYEIMTAHY